MSAPKRNQAADAQDLYDDRSKNYDSSHHIRLAKHMVELAKVQPAECVLDLACGTGLVTYPASSAVGTSGSVVGVDISSGMLSQANAKLPKHDLKNIAFHYHSITELDTLDAIKDQKFDVIICCSALVLLEDAGAALKQWTTYLKPGGRLVIDVTHPLNLASGLVFERVGRRMERPLPWYREPFQTPDDLQSIMEAAGLNPVEVIFLSIYDIEGTDKLEDYIVPSFDKPKIHKQYDISDADKAFDEAIDTHPFKTLANPADVRDKARELFREEWAKIANADSKVQVVDGLFVGIGHKT